MTNLTRGAGVVHELDSLDSLIPPTGTRLAVFRRTRQGERFHGVLEPGEAMRPLWFQSRSSFRLLAISTDPNLRHEFSQSYLHRDQVHNFDLHFRIEYRVSNPQTLVETLSRDPLARIEEEISTLLGRSVRDMEWIEVQREPHRVGERTLLTEQASSDGRLQSPLVRLRKLSEDYGIELLDVSVTCRLGERGVRQDLLKVDSEYEREELQEGLATAELRRLGEKNIQYKEKELEREIATVDRSRQMADHMLNHLNRALEKVADGVDSAPSLRQAIVELAKLQSELHGLTSTIGPVASALEGARPRVLPRAVSYLDGERELMDSLIEHVSDLDCPADVQRRVLGKALQVQGEVLQGEEENGELLERRIEELTGLLDGSIRALRNPEQRKFFRDLCDVEWWRHRP